jgi:hypothetical protein
LIEKNNIILWKLQDQLCFKTQKVFQSENISKEVIQKQTFGFVAALRINPYCFYEEQIFEVLSSLCSNFSPLSSIHLSFSVLSSSYIPFILSKNVNI